MKRQCSVLIVDDDHDIRDTLADVLTDEGFEVASAADGFEALEYLRSHPSPDLILLDWMMPRCDGARFREEQRSDASIASVPVILLTADTRKNDTVRQTDAADYLAKPVKLEELLAKLEQYCK